MAKIKSKRVGSLGKGDVTVSVTPVVGGRDIGVKVDGYAVGSVLVVKEKQGGLTRTGYISVDEAGDVTLAKSQAQALKGQNPSVRPTMKKALISHAGEGAVSRAHQIVADRASKLRGGASRFGSNIGGRLASLREKLATPTPATPAKRVSQHRVKRGSGVTRRRDR